MLPTAQYEGRWEVQPNGDVQVTRRFKLPMQMYRAWKTADVHMLEARGFASQRSNVEVAGKKADWDDLNCTLTLTMTVLGLGRNMGTHWEATALPNVRFSNLDENRKTAYFHFAADTEGGRVEGQDHVVLPPQAGKPTWNASDRTLTYTLPAPPTPAAAGTHSSWPLVWWLACGLCLAAGAAALGVSFVSGPRRTRPA
jgi:hypothetical protein